VGTWKGLPATAQTNLNGGNLPDTFIWITVSPDLVITLALRNCTIDKLAEKVRQPNTLDQYVSNRAGHQFVMKMAGASVGPVQ